MFFQCFRTCVMAIAAELARLRCGFRVGSWGLQLGEAFQNIFVSVDASIIEVCIVKWTRVCRSDSGFT